MDEHALAAVEGYWRAANYVTVAQLYLQSNVQLYRSLRAEDVKPVILGHWGVSPALNFVYSHLSLAARVSSRRIGLVVGPAHAAAALLANLFLDGTLLTEYEELAPTGKGLESLVNAFGHRGRFHTEISPLMPGVIYQGGELGHSLAVAQGSVLDRPGTVVACFIGDGEAETGGISAAWLGGKFLHPATSGAVLPILNLNGFKMGSRSILATMQDAEIMSLLEGNGYRPLFVGPKHEDLHRALIDCLATIEDHRAAFPDKCQPFDRSWPAIVLRTPKGWTGPSQHVGSASSHKAPIRNAHSCSEALQALEDWLRSYRPQECFDEHGMIAPSVLRCLPKPSHRIGRFFIEPSESGPRHLTLPNPKVYSMPAVGATHVPTVPVANFLADVIRGGHSGPQLRVFCPDEVESNRFEAVLEATTRTAIRASQGCAGSPAGRVMEVLNEPLCLGWMLGYVRTGRHGVLITYEAFAPILASMVMQHLRFVKQRKDVAWAGPIGSLNIVLTSLCWQNCYTHQNPDFIGLPFAKGFDLFEVYTPCDGNSFLASVFRGMTRLAVLNIYVVSKTELAVVRNFNQSMLDVDCGCSVMLGNEDDEPDVVLAVCGDFLLPEAQLSIDLAKARMPSLEVRLVYVSRLGSLGGGCEGEGTLDDDEFRHFFTRNRPVLFLFCGYAVHLKGILFDRPKPDRFHVLGYQDTGLAESSKLLVSLGLDRVALASALIRLAFQYATTRAEKRTS